MTDNPSRSEVWATHEPCGHTWIIAHLPMDLAKAAKMMQAAHCPKCGDKDKIYVASEADIVAALAATAPVQFTTPKPVGMGEAPWPAF